MHLCKLVHYHSTIIFTHHSNEAVRWHSYYLSVHSQSPTFGSCAQACVVWIFVCLRDFGFFHCCCFKSSFLASVHYFAVFGTICVTWLSWTKLISITYYEYPSLRTARGLVEAFVHSRFVKSRNLIVLLKYFKYLSQGPYTLTVDLSLQERWWTHRIQHHLITMQGLHCITEYQFHQNWWKISVSKNWV